MAMAVMVVRGVRMSVHKARVRVPMCVRLPRWVTFPVLVTMMLVMHMHMRVLQGFVLMLVGVCFSEMDRDSSGDQ